MASKVRYSKVAITSTTKPGYFAGFTVIGDYQQDSSTRYLLLERPESAIAPKPRVKKVKAATPATSATAFTPMAGVSNG